DSPKPARSGAITSCVRARRSKTGAQAARRWPIPWSRTIGAPEPARSWTSSMWGTTSPDLCVTGSITYFWNEREAGTRQHADGRLSGDRRPPQVSTGDHQPPFAGSAGRGVRLDTLQIASLIESVIGNPMTLTDTS